MTEPSRGGDAVRRSATTSLNSEIELTDLLAFLIRRRFLILASTMCGLLLGAGIWALTHHGHATKSASSQWEATFEAPAGSEIAMSMLPTILMKGLSRQELAKAFYAAIPAFGAAGSSRIDDWVSRQKGGLGFVRGVAVTGRKIVLSLDSGETWTMDQVKTAIVPALNGFVSAYNSQCFGKLKELSNAEMKVFLSLASKKTEAIKLLAQRSTLPPAVNQVFVANLIGPMAKESSKLNATLFLLGALPDSEPQKAALINDITNLVQEESSISNTRDLLKSDLGFDPSAELPKFETLPEVNAVAQSTPISTRSLALLLMIGAIAGCVFGMASAAIAENLGAALGKLRTLQ